jgi:hypothetical protein
MRHRRIPLQLTALTAVAGGTCLALGLAAVSGSPALAWTKPSPSLLVTTLSNAGPGSLRAAINAANLSSAGGNVTIDFSVRGVITLTSALPAITGAVTIDGTSAPGHRSGGSPVVEINANRQRGLVFATGSAGSELLGLAIGGARGNGVTLQAGAITVNENYIGLGLRGKPLGNTGNGLFVTSSRNLIGLNPSGDSGVWSNIISANGGSGVVLSYASGNTLVANRIGTSPAGTTALGNGKQGLSLIGASHNEIGGTAYVDQATGQANNPTGSKGTTTPVFVVPPDGNLISGNISNGVKIGSGSASNDLNGNFIGTTADGDAELSNGANGVWITRSDDNSLTGCKFVNNPFVYYNVISGNQKNGLRISNSDDTTVQGNFLGSAANNSGVLGNKANGILVDGDSASTQVGGVIPLGNVSAGNGQNGIAVTGTASGFTTFNTFGGLHAFGGAAPNGRDGVLITATGGDNLVRTNVMSGNTGNGIELGGNASGVTVDPNIAGLTTNGQAVLANGGDGLLIDGSAHDNVIAGSYRSVIPQNTFGGNDGYGVAITGRAYGNQLTGAFVGTNILGVTALGNQKGGVLLAGRASQNLIGSLTTSPANLISGNDGIGVTLLKLTRSNQVFYNYIGLNRFGKPLPNTGQPILDLGSGNNIRGNRT